MAAILGTLKNNPMGDSSRAQESERGQWEFSTPVVQEVSLPARDFTSQPVSLPVI